MLRSHMWNPPIDMKYYKLSVLSGINLHMTLLKEHTGDKGHILGGPLSLICATMVQVQADRENTVIVIEAVDSIKLIEA